MKKRAWKPSPPPVVGDKEDIMSTPAQRMSMTNATPTADELKKVLFYIHEEILKEFKKRAIDENKTYSQLAEDAIKAYLRNPSPHH